MAIRNFWVEGDIDGRETTLSGGPRASNGGMDVTIKQRDKNSIVVAVRISCRRRDDGLLVTSVRDKDNNPIVEIVTER